MEIVIASSAAEVAMIAADVVCRVLARCGQPVLGLATGNTPVLTYRELISRYRRGEISFRSAHAFLLDEYVGLGPDHPERYRAAIMRDFTAHVDFNEGAVHGLDGGPSGPEVVAAAYEGAIAAAGGIDIQLLGIGRNGHIGFNEPSSSLASRTRLAVLTEATRQDNARFFGHDLKSVPRLVMTQGIGTILDARHLVLIAAGEAKAAPVAAAIEGPLTAMVPASALQLHPRVTVILDEAAAARLQHAEYYRQAYDFGEDACMRGDIGWSHAH